MRCIMQRLCSSLAWSNLTLSKKGTAGRRLSEMCKLSLPCETIELEGLKIRYFLVEQTSQCAVDNPQPPQWGDSRIFTRHTKCYA